MSRGCLGSRTVGSLGVRRSPRPMSRRNTRSTPSIRSCSSCCGGARSSTACSARSSTASSEPAAAAATSHPRALDGGTPLLLPRCLWSLPWLQTQEMCFWKCIEIIKPWCVCGYLWVSAPVAKIGFGAWQTWVSGLPVPLGLWAGHVLCTLVRISKTQSISVLRRAQSCSPAANVWSGAMVLHQTGRMH